MRSTNIIRAACTFAAAALLPATAANAATPADLMCIDDRLELSQRAAIGKLFAEPSNASDTTEGKDQEANRRLGEGTAQASADFANVIGSCAERFKWNENQRQMAEDYLINLGNLSIIAFKHETQWSEAMERYARLGVTLLPSEGDPDDHLRAVLAAGARANGVPPKAHDEEAGSDIVAYLKAYRRLRDTMASFPA